MATVLRGIVRALRCFLLAIVVFSSGALGAIRPNPYLREGQRLYDELEFRQCVDRLVQAQRLDTQPAEMAQVEMYLGLCRYNLGEATAALEHFRIALRIAPDLTLPAMTSPKLLRLFGEVREEISKETPPSKQPEPLKKLEPSPVPLDKPWVVAPIPARRKHTSTPYILAAGALVPAGVAGLFGLQAQRLATSANASERDSDYFRLATSARTDASVANVGFAAAAVVGTGALALFLWEVTHG